MTKEELRAAFSKLSAEDRLDLVDELWRDLHGDPDARPLSPEQAEELERRLRHLDENPGPYPTWEEVRARFDERRQ